MWRSGKNFKKIEFNQIEDILKEVSKNKEHKVMIGSDSQLKGNYCLFVTAICIINKSNDYHSRYFYKKLLVKDGLYKHLSNRLLKETTESINLSELLVKKISDINIEIHSDINPKEYYASNKYSSMVLGYITGCGFPCIFKPDSYVASSVADKHTKNHKNFR